MLELDCVSRDFLTPDGRVYRAIDEVSLSVPAGAFVAIV
jgi:ABC-type oligopeptide transport system ATPase subunit